MISLALPPAILSATPFIPHTLAHLIEAHVFPSPIPEPAYAKFLKEYGALQDIAVSRMVYASDGLKVTGLMALPRHVEPGKHPLLIYNRGGKEEYGKLTVISVLRAMAPFAQRGYLVFASNYRGNDGGEGREQFGGDDVDDVLNLLAIARQHPAFDGKNAYMIGHSRGGMMTEIAIRQGAAVSAAVVIAGISDLWEAAKERPSMVERVFDPLIPGVGGGREEEYRKRSSACWAEEIAVPLLLLHGDADPDVAVTHSLRLAEKMRQAHRTCELHIYPQGNHALIRFWDDVTARCLAWLERYRQ